jgi:hypothetical protein
MSLLDIEATRSFLACLTSWAFKNLLSKCNRRHPMRKEYKEQEASTAGSAKMKDLGYRKNQKITDILTTLGVLKEIRRGIA